MLNSCLRTGRAWRISSIIEVRQVVTWLLVALSLSWAAQTLAQSPPQLIRTAPGHGAVGVAPDIGVIVLEFDQEMRMDSWTLEPAGNLPFPPVLQDPQPWRDARTFVMRVGPLTPGAVYGLNVNGPNRSGFQAAATGLPVPVSSLSFTVAGGGGSMNQPDSGSQPLADQSQFNNWGSQSPSQHNQAGTWGGGALPAGPVSGPARTVVFHRATEPNEQAFTLLIPKGWRLLGGIVRANPMAAGGPVQAMAAKVDMAIARDDAATVYLRRIPDVYYTDPRHLSSYKYAAQLGIALPPLDNYMGMALVQRPSAQDFLAQFVFPSIHPQATDVQLIDARPLPNVAQTYQQGQVATQQMLQTLAAVGIQGSIGYDAGLLVVEYNENGIRFRESIATIIDDMGEMAQGMWVNRETTAFRAPVQEFEVWAPITSVILGSVQLNPAWIDMEIRAQARSTGKFRETMADLRRIDEEIVEHRRKTNAEIRNDMYLNLTNQEEYVNPFTNKVETDTNQYTNRWVTPTGELVLSNDPAYDPRYDSNITITGWERTPIRPRFPQ